MRLEDLRVGQRVVVVNETKHPHIHLHTVEVHRIHHPDTGAVNIRVLALDGPGETYHSGRTFAGFIPDDLDFE